MNSESKSTIFYQATGAILLDRLSKKRKGDLDLIKGFCKVDHKILDLGCGVGRITIPLLQQGYNISGVDLSPNLVKEAKKRLKSLDFENHIKTGSMLKIPYKKNTFDRIVCMWTAFNELLLKSEQILALNEMYRVLHPGGIAFLDLTDGEKKSIKKTLAEQGKGAQKKVLEGEFNGVKHSCYFHDKATLNNICQQSIFKSFSIRFMNLNHERRLVVFLNKL